MLKALLTSVVAVTLWETALTDSDRTLARWVASKAFQEARTFATRFVKKE